MRNSVQQVARFLLLFLAASPAFAGAPTPGPASVPGEVLVKFQAGASTEDISGLQIAADVDTSQRLTSVKSGKIYRLHSRSLSAESLTSTLLKNPNVVYAEPNYIVHASSTPNDPSYSFLWGLKNTGQTIGGVLGASGADIHAEAAWGVTTGSASIVVGVVDTGVDYTHPDLAANIWSNPGGKGNVACAAGTHGFNAITMTCDPRDDHYHGTHVSGTIGALGNNSLGVVGVNWTTSIMALKFLDYSGSGTNAGAIAAIDFAVQAKIDGVNVRVLSNSWGGGAFSKALFDEINKANDNDILFVAAAGNDSANNDSSPHYPANYATANMISVAATDNLDGMAYFSDYGPTTVHLGAPGLNVLSCYPGGSYQYLSGTSMATPHVSGVAALVLAQTPGLTTAQVKSAILNNTDPIASQAGKTITGGRLNAARALGVAPGPDFSITVNPPSRNLTQGASTTYSVTITPSSGFAGSVDLSATNLPTGVTASFAPTPTTANSILTLTATGSATTGSRTITITGTSGALSHGASSTLAVIQKPATTACPSLSGPLDYLVYPSPNSVAMGDFNRDGNADLVTVATASNLVSVVIGSGNGGFQNTINYSVGGAPLSVTVGDFNGDGKADFAVANSTTNNVSILLGNGDGTFQTAVNYNAGTNPFWVSTGDFNGDGKLDLVIANDGSSNVSILLGQGDGTFQAAVNYSVGSGPYSVSAGDLNGDGRADLAVASYNTNKVFVLLGNGDGTFQAATSYAVASGPSSVVLADFDGDGKHDLAVTNYASDNVSILLGNGDGTFQPAVNYAVGSGPNSVVVLDVDGDGKPDLAVVNSNSNNLSLLAGNGDGTFRAAVNYLTGTDPLQAVVGDFNADGKPDLAVSVYGDYYSSSYVAIFLNNGVCSLNCDTLAAAVNYTVGSGPDSITAADFNADGRPDLAVVNNAANNVSVLLGNGDGTFVSSGTSGAGSGPYSVASADLNGDGKRDLAVANDTSGDVSILFGNGNGTFQPAVNYSAGSNPHSVAIGDFNRDGKPDLAVASSGSGNVSVLLNAGGGTFLPAVSYAASANPESVVVGDFNRDGKLDLAVANTGSGTVSILLGNGDGTFQAASNVAVGTNPFFVIAADLNHDGKVDLAVANSGSNNVSILIGNGNGTFHTAVNYNVGTTPYSLTAADLNLDGIPDLAVTNNGSNDVSLLIGYGDGTFVLAGGISAGTGPHAIVARDFNHDGKPDLAVANQGSNNASILINTCPVPDLTLTKTHVGTFAQGDSGKIYTITVTNVGAGPTNAAVSVTDALPPGLSATAITGTGWTCSVATVSCTRSDVLAAGSSFLPITLTVNVANSAPSSVINTATVSGGGEVNSANNTVTDPTTITPVTDLIISGTHSGNFAQGAMARTYSITARNAGGSPTSGTVTVTDSLPAGLTVVAMTGTGWACNSSTLTCTRSDALGGASSYPSITLTVNVAANAPTAITNVCTVSGGGEGNTSNDTSTDPTTIWSSQTCGSFGTAVVYNTGYGPSGLALGDFNGDGKADLVVAGSYYGTLSVILGNGNGTFSSPTQYLPGSNVNAVAVADVNNDGHPDLVATDSSLSTLSVLLGNGDGTFAAAVHYAVGSNPQAVVAGDFNGDGNIDFAVANYTTGDVSILLGNGNGTLRPAVAYSAGGYGTSSVAIGDFDGNGKIDLAVTNSNYGWVYILRGNGDGSFQAPVSYAAGYNPGTVAVADFNGDGKPDIAVTGYYSGGLEILLGNGNGTFQAAVYYATPYGTGSLAIDDINGDGKPDIAVASSGSNNVSVLFGNGNGTFQTPVSFYNNGGPSHIVIGDFNGDGKPDFAVTENYSYGVGIMLGGCPDLTIAKSHSGLFVGGQSGTYTLTVTNSAGGSSQGTVTAADVLPSGLSATFIGGSGWSCDLASVRCTRSDTLAGGASFPPVFVTVNISKSAPTFVTNVATVAGGSDTNLANNSASDPTTIVQAPDLIITLSHSGTFAQGQTGRTFTITVENIGGAATSGTVVATDDVFTGLTVTAMAGTGWTCNLPSFACSRSDSLGVSAAFPPITVTVSADLTAPPSVLSLAFVSGGGETFTGNDSAVDAVAIVGTPAHLAATATSNTQISLTWDSVVYATSYQVWRSSNNGPYTLIASPITNYFADSSLTPNTTYVYRVQAADLSAIGPPSNTDLATTMLFTDDPLIASSTRIKAVHIIELRAAVNATRAAAGLPPASFTDPALTPGSRVKAAHISELRANLDPARAALGVPSIAYTDPGLAPGTRIKAAHVQELRAGVK